MTKPIRGRAPPGNEAARLSPSQEARPKRFNGNGNARRYSLAELQAQANRPRRRQHLAVLAWRLGARAYFEFINELDRHYDIPDLDDRLERYANADPNLVALLGGDRFPEGPTRIIGGGR